MTTIYILINLEVYDMDMPTQDERLSVIFRDMRQLPR